MFCVLDSLFRVFFFVWFLYITHVIGFANCLHIHNCLHVYIFLSFPLRSMLIIDMSQHTLPAFTVSSVALLSMVLYRPLVVKKRCDHMIKYSPNTRVSQRISMAAYKLLFSLHRPQTQLLIKFLHICTFHSLSEIQK